MWNINPLICAIPTTYYQAASPYLQSSGIILSFTSQTKSTGEDFTKRPSKMNFLTCENLMDNKTNVESEFTALSS